MEMNFRTKNEPTGAVYGFTNTLLSIINEFLGLYWEAAQDVKSRIKKKVRCITIKKITGRLCLRIFWCR